MGNIFSSKDLKNEPKKTLLKSTGFTDDDFSRPLIGIIYSQNDTVNAHNNIVNVVNAVKEGVISAGGKPVSATVMSICSGISMGQNGKYLLPSRELLIDSVESIAFASGFDAIVFVGSCDSFVPAMLIAAARLNIPSLFVSTGTSQPGYVDDKKVGFSSMLEGIHKIRKGKISTKTFEDIKGQSCATPGSGCEMSTSNTMNCLTEALGLALPRNGTLPAHSTGRILLAKQSGSQIINVLNKQLTPKKILTVNSVLNAVKFVMAASGSLDAILHLIALAGELDIQEKNFSYEVIDGVRQKTPCIVKTAPYNDYFIDDFDRAGGVLNVMKKLIDAGLADGTALTITGDSLKNLSESVEADGGDIIREFSSPYSKTGAVTVLYGSLAEEGALIRSSFVPDSIKTFSGKALVYEGEEAALFAINEGAVSEGNVVVIRYEGPKGSPGMREMRAVTSAVAGLGLENKVAIVTDGRVGGTSKGLVVGHVCPEAAEEGNIAYVLDGDTIEIDLVKCRLNLDVSSKEIQNRKKRTKLKETDAKGYLQRYSQSVSSSRYGAVFKKSKR